MRLVTMDIITPIVMTNRRNRRGRRSSSEAQAAGREAAVCSSR